jgi:hypothetical protein
MCCPEFVKLTLITFPIITINAPLIYTSLCIMFRMHAYPLRGEVGGGWGPGIREFFGPCEMALSR